MSTVDDISLSILVPVYNTGSYLGFCLESLAAQNVAGIEFVCLDDGSTDGPGGIITQRLNGRDINL